MRKGLLFLAIMVSACANAQPLLVVKGAEVSISPGASIFIGGSVQIDSVSVFQHAGFAAIDGNLDNYGNLSQSGQIDLIGNWNNSGIYIATNNSIVQLNGINQQIKGDSASHYGQLNFTDIGLKELLVEASAFNANLGNSQLHTHQHTFLIRNSAASALVYDSAWVLSDLNGQLRRQTSVAGMYNFPVGDEFAMRLVQYQPVTASQVGVRYANVDANIDGLSRFQVSPELCALSDSAYVRLYDFPNSGTVGIRFPNAIVDNFPVLCQRNSSLAQSWNPALVTSFETVADTTTFILTPSSSNVAFILGRLRPEQPVILGDDELCSFSLQQEYSIESIGSNTLVWSVSGGVANIQSDVSVLVDWGENGTGLVSLVQTDVFGCSSLPSDMSIVLHPLPSASIGLISPALPFENEVYQLYSENQAALYSWQFSHGISFIDSLIQVSFDQPGNYQAVLQVENEFGCLDTAQVSIEILEGLLMGNVITPNGDGINDYFEFPNSGITKYKLSVFNRWGTVVFESDQAKTSWDGRDASGQQVTPGTYFYVLNARSGQTDYSKKGSLQIIY